MLHRMAAVIGLLLLWAIPASAQTGTMATLMPQLVYVGLDNNGNPIVSGKLCAYYAGSTTPAPTYGDASRVAAHTWPIILDTAGRAVVFLDAGISYKFVLRTFGLSGAECTSGTIIYTVDGVGGVPSAAANLDALGTAGEALAAGDAVYLSDGSGGKPAGQWAKASSNNAYSSTQPPVGFATTAIASGAAGTIRSAGTVTGMAATLVVGTDYYLNYTGGALTATAPMQNPRLVGRADTTSSLVLVPYSTLSAPWKVITLTNTGTVNNLGVNLMSGDTIIRLNNATALTIQGIGAVAAGIMGQRLLLIPVNVGTVTLVDESVGAPNDFRIHTGVTGDRVFAGTSGGFLTGSYVELMYDTAYTRWVVTGHDPGSAIPYTPTWTNTGTANTLGNGTLTGTYRLRGREVFFTISLTFGTTTTSGVGQWRFGLPMASNGAAVMVTGMGQDSSAGGTFYPTIGIGITSTTFAPITSNGAPALGWTDLVPFTWAVGDVVTLSGTYIAN